MDKDYSELVEYLDQKFGKVDQRFIEVNEKLGSLEEKQADKEDINNLITAIDSYAKKADTYFQEMVMLAHKVDKLDKWIHRIAERVGIKLEE